MLRTAGCPLGLIFRHRFLRAKAPDLAGSFTERCVHLKKWVVALTACMEHNIWLGFIYVVYITCRCTCISTYIYSTYVLHRCKG